MNDSDTPRLEQIQSLLGDGANSAANPFNSLLEPLVPVLTLLFVLGIVLTVVWIIAIIVNMVQRHRTHSAILRIDRNVQLLVDGQDIKKGSETISVHRKG